MSFLSNYRIKFLMQSILTMQGSSLEKGGKTMFGKNSKMSKNVQKSRTPRQASNVEAGSEMKNCGKNCSSSTSNKSSSKTSNKTSSKSSTNAKNCK